MSPRARLALLCAASLVAAGCAAIERRGAPPRGTPSGRPGWLAYTLQGLRVQAPATWTADGDGKRLTLAAPDGRARLELTVPETPFADERACLGDAETRLGSGAENLERVRRHPTRLGGHPGQSLEGDRGEWHVWAIAACDGGMQYRVFLTAASPASAEVVEVWRTLLQSARIGGEA